MTNYQTFHTTVTGHSHIAKGTVCEDFSASYSEAGLHIAVVSDGHGDPACFRSHIGSKAAVEIAMENLRAFAGNIRRQGWESMLLRQPEQERLVRQLIRSIMGNWTIRVMEQLDSQPITPEEYAVSRSYEPLYRAGRELTHIFGCTLIATLVTDTYMIVLHQGDGRCVVIHSDGTADQPVPWDDRCVGNICTSLCHADAVESCRYYVADLRTDPVAACFVTTDGIEDSLENLDALNAYCCYISNRFIEKGTAPLTEALEQELPRMSQLGSGDDMSLSGVLQPERITQLSERLSLIYQLQICGTEERKARSKLNSMQRKMEYLKNEVTRTQGEYNTLRSQYAGTNQLLSKLRQELQQLLKKQDDDQAALESAAQKVQQAQDAFDEYNAVHVSYLEKEQEAQSQAARIRQHLETLPIPPLPPQAEPATQTPDWESETPIPWEQPSVLAEAPAKETLAAETPVEETPAGEAVPEETPMEEAPAEESLTENVPAEDAPAQEILPEKIPDPQEEDEEQQAFFVKLMGRIFGKNSKHKDDSV